MVWPCKHGMVHGMALRAWHGICYGFVSMACYMVLLDGPGMIYGYPGGHGMVYGIA